MVIRVLDHKYFVMNTIVSGDGLDQYVCRDLSGEDSEIYRIVRIPHDDVTPELMRYLTDIDSSESFNQLREYSNEGDFLCVVMDCGSSRAVSLRKKIAREQPSFKERLGYVYGLIERLILSDIPVYFATSALNAESIRLTPALDIAFDFDIHDILGFESRGMEDVCTELADVIMEVFDAEMSRNSLAELTQLVRNLRLRRYTDYLAIFADYKVIYEKYSGSEDDIELENNSFPFRLWDMLKNLCAQVKKYAYLLLLVLAAAYLVMTIRNIFKPTQQKDIYDYIGDMQIGGAGDAASADAVQGTDAAQDTDAVQDAGSSQYTGAAAGSSEGGESR